MSAVKPSSIQGLQCPQDLGNHALIEIFHDNRLLESALDSSIQSGRIYIFAQTTMKSMCRLVVERLPIIVACDLSWHVLLICLRWRKTAPGPHYGPPDHHYKILNATGTWNVNLLAWFIATFVYLLCFFGKSSSVFADYEMVVIATGVEDSNSQSDNWLICVCPIF